MTIDELIQRKAELKDQGRAIFKVRTMIKRQMSNLRRCRHDSLVRSLGAMAAEAREAQKENKTLVREIDLEIALARAAEIPSHWAAVRDGLG